MISSLVLLFFCLNVFGSLSTVVGGISGFAAGYSLWLNAYFRIVPVFVIMGLLAVYTPIRPLKYILVGLMALEGLSFIMIDGAKLLKRVKH